MTAFIFKLKLKNCDHIFKDGFEPGVLVTQEADFAGCEADYLAAALFHHEIKFVKEFIKVEIEEVK